MQQEGFPGFVVEMFNGLVGRAGLSPAIVSRLNGEVNEILKDPDLPAKLDAIGLYPMRSGTPEHFRTYIQEQLRHWRGVVTRAGIAQEG